MVEKDNGLLQKYDDVLNNNEFLVNFEEYQEKEDTTVIDKYEKYKENENIINVYVNRADVEGNLFCSLEDGKFVGKIPNKEVEGKPYDPRFKHKKIDRNYSVIVTDVDAEKNIIYLSFSKAKEIAKDALRVKLIKALDEGQQAQVKARVMFVNYAKRIYINIGGVDLLGYIPINKWKRGYVYNIEESVKPNTVITVEVQKYNPARNNKGEVFICSREAVLPDPWVGIEEKIPLHSTIVLTAIKKRERNFFGRIEGLEDIDIFCEYPEADKDISIKTGMKYKGYIYAVSEERKLLKARIFDEEEIEG